MKNLFQDLHKDLSLKARVRQRSKAINQLPDRVLFRVRKSADGLNQRIAIHFPHETYGQFHHEAIDDSKNALANANQNLLPLVATAIGTILSS